MHFVLTGPESSGKTALAEALAAHFQTPWVPEVARTYLNSANYQATDLLTIANEQQSAEAVHAGNFVFCDTDLQTVYVWWQERFGPAPLSLARAYARQSPRHYLLCKPDLPWQPDPLRENPHDRERLFALYQKDLDQRGLPYHVITGTGEKRLNLAAEIVTRVLGALPLP